MAINNINISVFPSIYDIDHPTDRPLLDILYEIRNGTLELVKKTKIVRKTNDKKERNQLKCRLLYPICFGGTFSKRDDGNLINLSGIVCLDLDNVQDHGAVKAQLKAFHYVLAVFRSPSGSGLKVLVLTNLTDAARFKDLYRYLGQEMGLSGRIDLEFDTHTSVSRACFYSHDSSCWINKNVQPFNVPTNLPVYDAPATLQKEKSHGTEVKKENVASNTILSAKDVQACILREHELFEEYYQMYPGVRNSNLFILACFFREGGVPEGYAVDYLVAYYVDKSNGFSASEIEATVRSAYRT